MISEIERQRRIAIPKAVSGYTVLIDISLASGVRSDWGTGSIFKFNERLFILTCKHVVKEGYNLEQIRYFADDGMEQNWTDSKDDIINMPMARYTSLPRTSAVILPVIHRSYSDDEDDLVLLELDQTSDLFNGYNFYDMELSVGISPDIDAEACLLGFSRDLVKTPTSHSRGCYFPYFLASTIITEKNVSIDKYDKERHFLIEYENNESSVDIRGLSGCGIWTHIVPKPDEIWTSNLRLVGVETSINKRNEVIKATRIEKVIELLESIKA